MVCVSLHWSKYEGDNLALWGFDVNHDVWLHNCIPNHLSGLTPIKLLIKTKANHHDLLCTHVWVCPVYIIDPKLQDGQKIPKWNYCSCSHLGQFLGLRELILHKKMKVDSTFFHRLYDCVRF